MMGSCSRLLPKDVALAGKSNSSTGDENDSVELEYNNIAYIVIFLFSFLIFVDARRIDHTRASSSYEFAFTLVTRPN